MDLEKVANTIHTKKEIEGQPALWISTINSLKKNKNIQKFLSPLVEKKELNIILTGAGSSSYIGESVQHLFRFKKGIHARAVSTTTLVTHFKNHIDPETPLLLISFARSGNSPESNAVVDITENFCSEVHHIAITCNENGKLAKKVNEMPNGLAIILPPESEDQGLAMTGSFTSMILAAIYVANYKNFSEQSSLIEHMASSAEKIIEECSPGLKELSYDDFDRIVFLGSGPLLAISKESHLKVQELTDGYVVGKFDSFLGFRHGPKAVVNNNTVLVFLFSTDQNVFRYEKDLVEQIIKDGIAKYCVGVFCDKEQAEYLNLDQKIVFELGEEQKKSAYHLLLDVLPAQIIGYYKSLDLGLNPDSPSQNNAISRVVKGVTIYPLNNEDPLL
ncbi:MAG: SIS domain-containing protein [Balneolaceae bacterium]